MGRYLRITIASILALAMAGCSGGGDDSAVVEPVPEETAENNPDPKTEPFKEPLVPPKPKIGGTPSNLIEPTNPTERVGIVSRGRTDPFDDIVPSVKFPTNNQDSEDSAPANTTNTATKQVARKVPKLPPLPKSNAKTVASRPRPRRVAVKPRRSAVISARTGGNARNPNSGNLNSRNQQTANKPGANGSKGTASVPVVPQKLPGVVAQPDLTSLLPPPPEPKLAQAVLVSGVVQVGNRPQAIIKVPSEPTSRYVQAGQRLASGLLVKRIEMNEGSEPVVILEQYGIEVARLVGEAPMGDSQPATAATEETVSTLPSSPKSASVGAS
ncbi:hypothetical protein NIES267_52130 [Calothrix parasitica NIES-267]|uniref:Uncharacterized protein n=1 Tax=Calothrix parasitica NIES-267 TaxID=1973488 RepID=A0A1Z4LWV7_9CYAN|nr:hypothetical protein NIES267_52130 [Calothrix parasitica NIES-267]